MRCHVPFVVSLFLVIAIGVRTSSAQVQSGSGKAWKAGGVSSQNFVQLIVTRGQSPQISGQVSLRCAGLWQGAKAKNFSGTQRPVLDFIRIDCTCEDGMKFAGWYWPGATGSRADDRTVIYFRPIATPSEAVPDCHPDDGQLVAYESDEEPLN